MEKVIPRTLSGFMELLPADQINMEKIKRILQDTYSSYGFYPLDTPVIESSEVLLAKGGGDTEKQIYRFAKGDSNLALRFDLCLLCLRSFPQVRWKLLLLYPACRCRLRLLLLSCWSPFNLR